MLISDTIAFWLATTGVCAAALGLRGFGLVLVTPAVLHWIVWPALWGTARELPLWLLVSLIPFAIIAAILAGLRLLQRAVELAFGREAAGFVAGTYLVRIFDAIGRGFVRFLLSFACRPRGRPSNRRPRW